MFGNSPFGETRRPGPEIDLDCEVVVVSDMFVEDYVGGAELTSEALIQSCPMRVLKLHSQLVDVNVLQGLTNAYWVFGNFSQMNVDMIPSIVANLKYSVLEYDYKYCKYRWIHTSLSYN